MLRRVQKYSLKDTGHSSDQEQKKSGMERTYKPNGLWNNAEMMMINLGESGHSVFRGTSASARGFLKSKGGGKTLIHDIGGSATAELLFRIIASVNQLSVYGAVLDWCEELAQQILPVWRDLLWS